jgi:hypothetical protein
MRQVCTAFLAFVLISFLICGCDTSADRHTEKAAAGLPAVGIEQKAVAHFKAPAAAKMATEFRQPPLVDKGRLPVERKLVYLAEFELTVSDLAKAEQELDRLLQTHKGILASSDVSGAAGGTRTGVWVVRVPPAQFGDFNEGIKKLGELTRYTSKGDDVTEEFYDLETRVRNKEAELEKLRKLFDQSAGKIDDVIKVVQALSVAQSELEQMKGRQRVLSNLIDLTTITLRVQERGSYEAPGAISYGERIGNTLSGSTTALLEFGKGTLLVAVALVPWLPVIALLGTTGWYGTRRILRRQALPPA